MTRTDDADPDPFQPVGVITGWIAIGGWLTGCPVRLGGTGVYTVRGPSGPLVHPASKTSDKPIAPESNVRVMATFLRDPSRDETNCRSTFDRQIRPLDITRCQTWKDGSDLQVSLEGSDVHGQADAHEVPGKRLREMFAVGRLQAKPSPFVARSFAKER